MLKLKIKSIYIMNHLLELNQQNTTTIIKGT